MPTVSVILINLVISFDLFKNMKKKGKEKPFDAIEKPTLAIITS